MLRSKIVIFFVVGIVILLSFPNINTTKAQESPFLYGVYPQRGSLGEEIVMLLSGDGLEDLGRLSYVVIGPEQIFVDDFQLISNQFIRVQFRIPQSTPVGETEISFIFDEFAMDAFFIVQEGEDPEISPVIRQLNPREAQVDTEVTLFLEGDRLFESGALGGVIIGDVEIPILGEESDSDQVMAVAIYLPPETPVGESGIEFYFENIRYQDAFLVTSPEIDGTASPYIYGISPQEAFQDSEFELFIDGENLSQLGEVTGVAIAEEEVPILDYFVESDQLAVLALYVPPEVPAGETRILIVYDNFRHADTFFVRGEGDFESQGEPILRSLYPLEGEPDTEIELYIDGQNLSALDELYGVYLSGYEIPVFDYEFESDETMVIYAYLPDDISTGDQFISIEFANAGIEDSFFVEEGTSLDFPVGVLILIGVVGVVGVGVVVGGGILALRSIRHRRASREKPDDRPADRQPVIDFKVGIDFGTQSVEPFKSSPSLDLDFQFEIDMDSGEQSIETSDDTFIDDDPTEQISR